MKDQRFSPHRRTLLGALGACALAPLLGARSLAQQAGAGSAKAGLTELRLQPRSLPLKAGPPPTPVWSLEDGSPSFISRTMPGNLNLPLTNEGTTPAAFEARGLDGAAQAEPLLAQQAIPPSGRTTLDLPLRQPGTFLLDARLLNDGAERPILPRVLIVDGGETFGADRDEVLLIEDWKIGADGKALTAGRDATDIASTYTTNRQATFDIKVKPNERVRLRLVNGCQRLVVALKIADHDLNVVAIDSKPAEPFAARDGQIILAPGTRVDALLDAARPPGTTSVILLHDGTKPVPVGQIVTSSDSPVRANILPTPASPAPTTSKIDLKNAQRVDLSLDPAQWMKANAFDKSSAPVFRTKKNRTVVLSITNSSASAATLHLHGHHVRLLDRLDDGWKPFWLDTLVFQPGQTQRVAFNAEFAGNWLIESMTTAWNSPRLLRWYAVE